MLRKLIVLAITSGLAKKAYNFYRDKRAGGTMASVPAAANRRNDRRATTRGAGGSARPDAS